MIEFVWIHVIVVNMVSLSIDNAFRHALTTILHLIQLADVFKNVHKLISQIQAFPNAMLAHHYVQVDLGIVIKDNVLELVLVQLLWIHLDWEMIVFQVSLNLFRMYNRFC